MRLATMTVIAFASVATPALSCSMSNWNVYESYFEPNVSQLVNEAATIDWVSVEPRGPRQCPRQFDTWVDDDQLPEAGLAGTWSEQCDYGGSTPWRQPDAALVIERLKGESPDRFSLAILRRPYFYDGEWSQPLWHAFSDLRETSIFLEVLVRLNEKAVAAGRHKAVDFWDRGASEFRNDRTNSCGGDPTLDPSLQYLVFRDADGSVLALEPVAYDDDVLLTRLRARRDEGASDIRESYPVDAFFSKATGLVQTRVDQCRVTGPSSEGEHGVLTVQRGDASFILDSQWSVGGSDDPDVWYEHGPPGARTFNFNDLPDYFAQRGEQCPARGESVLILSLDRPEAPRETPDLGWVEAEFPGWLEAVPQDWRTYLAPPSVYNGPHRPIRVSADGQVRLSDIPTALRLEGPETVTVDQIFQWFEEGRAVP